MVARAAAHLHTGSTCTALKGHWRRARQVRACGAETVQELLRQRQPPIADSKRAAAGLGERG